MSIVIYLRVNNMILPNKYINLSESVFGFAAYLSQFLNNPVSLDELWEVYQQHVKTGNYPIKNDFNELVLYSGPQKTDSSIRWCLS